MTPTHPRALLTVEDASQFLDYLARLANESGWKAHVAKIMEVSSTFAALSAEVEALRAENVRLDREHDFALTAKNQAEARVTQLTAELEAANRSREGLEGALSSVYALAKSIRYNALHGHQDRPAHVRLQSIATDAEAAIVRIEALTATRTTGGE